MKEKPTIRFKCGKSGLVFDYNKIPLVNPAPEKALASGLEVTCHVCGGKHQLYIQTAD
jgi:hypothetical protein